MYRLALPLALFATPTLAAPPPPPADVAWTIVEGLTTEVGQRLAGTEAEARGRDWAVRRLKALGFANVRIEPFPIPGWERGEERAEVVGPNMQRLTLTALGGSGATAAAGLTAPIVAFPTIAALEAAPGEAVRGRIVYLTHAMGPTQDGSSYGPFGDVRRKGPALASTKGAAAILVRSVGTGPARMAHTGQTGWGTAAPIPAAALALPDADQLERLLARGPVTLRLVLTPRATGPQPSGNVIAEIPGRDPKAGIVLVGGHLDSWDLGTGAVDDAAGLAITTAAVKAVAARGRPLRTIRVVWFGAEEVGGFGGDAYRDRHRAEKHVLAAESDFGADRVWRFDTRTAAPDAPLVRRIAEALYPLGIARGNNDAHPGTDVEPIVLDRSVPAVALRQDGMRYFTLHHTPDDTLDKIDRAALDQNVAAWTVLIDAAANSPEEMAPPPAPPVR